MDKKKLRELLQMWKEDDAQSVAEYNQVILGLGPNINAEIGFLHWRARRTADVLMAVLVELTKDDEPKLPEGSKTLDEFIAELDDENPFDGPIESDRKHKIIGACCYCGADAHTEDPRDANRVCCFSCGYDAAN